MALATRQSFGVAVCLGLIISMQATPTEAKPLSLRNQHLEVSLDVPSGLLAATDLRTGTRWRQHVPIQSAQGRNWGQVKTHKVAPGSLIRFTDATIDGSRILAKALWREHPFTVVFELVPEEPALTVTVDTLNRDDPLPWKPSWPGVMLMTYPYAFHNDQAGPDAVVPIDEGVIYSTRETDPQADPKRWKLWWLHKKLSMPWWGVTDGQQGVMTQIEDPFDCMFSIQWVRTPHGQRTLPQVTWIGAKGALAYQRRVTFRFVSEGGYVAMAKAFRAFEQARGAFRSWDEKVRANPAVARLRGALDVWHQRELTADLITCMKDAGIRRAIVAKPRGGDAPATQGIEPEAISAAVEAGYLVGAYHNDSWIQGRWIARDPALKDAAVLPADGKPAYIGNAWDAKGRLDRCPGAHTDVLRRKSREAREAGLNYFFTDCTTTGGAIHECYHPGHPARRRDGAGQLSAALRAASDQGVVVGSERGKWWATATTHVFEGIGTLIDYGGPYYGKGDATHWAGPYLTKSPGYSELFLGYDLNPVRRVPLFQLVYHDSVYCTRRWNQDPGRAPDSWDRHDLMNILYGTSSLIFMHPKAGNVIGTPDWEKVRGRYLQTYRNVCGWHEKIGFDEMTSHRFLSPDRLVQETRFSSGPGVVVNFGGSAWEDPRGFTIAAQDYRIVEP
ncbi:MAG: hypothetical protein HN742_18800 [Lentisphaerae bacterium]|jgi:hypothetical protein|nr:hypothetical protein [Lentisphaerota bacterium]MBT4821950.1 hypothetical protein [Lentisphaerota bacterium]MBT5605754.1 hypothetical protein [Lentisphaerota bacterium]MBT7053923.1 hypothetical protein [Lentisphaerota bacterium]MBT7843935.1 hypothetical protein [Lentisphaerota bacterium]